VHTLKILSRRRVLVGSAATSLLLASGQAMAFWPLLLRGLLFTGVRASTAARTATGAAASTVAGRALASPSRAVVTSPVWRQVQNGYRTVQHVDQYGRIVGERQEPHYVLVQVTEERQLGYRDVHVVLKAENHHPSCGQSFYSNFHLVSPKGQRTWAGGQQFCVPPGVHDFNFTLTGVPSGWQVLGEAHAGQNQVQTPNIIYV
jgi:hypothetical protein